MLERRLTLHEVAVAYRFTDRKLRRIVRERGVEVLRDGRDIIFDDHAIRSLEDVLRCDAKEPGSELKPEPIQVRLRSSGRLRAPHTKAR